MAASFFSALGRHFWRRAISGLALRVMCAQVPALIRTLPGIWRRGSGGVNILIGFFAWEWVSIGVGTAKSSAGPTAAVAAACRELGIAKVNWSTPP